MNKKKKERKFRSFFFCVIQMDQDKLFSLCKNSKKSCSGRGLEK